MPGNHLQAREYQRVYPLLWLWLKQCQKNHVFQLFVCYSQNLKMVSLEPVEHHSKIYIHTIYIYKCVYIYIYTLVSVLLQNSPQKKYVSVWDGARRRWQLLAGAGGEPHLEYLTLRLRCIGHVTSKIMVICIYVHIYIVQYVSRVYVVVRYVYTVCMYNYLYIYIWKFITFFLGGGNRT